MKPYQESRYCLKCRSRLTLFGQREPGSDRMVRHEVRCPVCGTLVAFVIPGLIDPGRAALVCYERRVGSALSDRR
jgi:hypothetical protein